MSNTQMGGLLPSQLHAYGEHSMSRWLTWCIRVIWVTKTLAYLAFATCVVQLGVFVLTAPMNVTEKATLVTCFGALWHVWSRVFDKLIDAKIIDFLQKIGDNNDNE
jgi:hypothetical protein